MATILNGFEVTFSAASFEAFIEDMPDPKDLRSRRDREAGEWLFLLA